MRLVAHVKDKVMETRSSGSRITHEGIWMTNIAYLLGFDSVYYDTTTRQFKVVGQGKQYLARNRIHVNKILPTVQNRLARLCKNPPRYDVRPKSSDIEDKEAAELSLQILNMVFDVQKVNRKRIPLMMWVQQCGHAYLKVTFDDQLGNPIEEVDGSVKYEGDIRIDVVSSFEVFPDPLAKDMDEAQWVVQAKVRKLDYFKSHYPERGHLVKEEGAWLLSAQYEARINQLNNQGPSTSGVQMALKNAAIELCYYERRSEKHPNGRMIICANGVLLKDDELPVGEFPLVKFDDVVVAGKFYSESLITHLRPIQDQYNRTITKRADWTNKLLAGKYIAAKGHGMRQESLNDASGECLTYNVVPNAPPPSALAIPVIPAYAYTEEERLDGMINDISGIGEVSRGNLPSAGIPAIGMQILIEQDDTRIGITIEQHEEAWAGVARLILLYAEQYYQTERLLKISGKQGEYTIKKFRGVDIKGNNDVIVIRGSTLPGSKALKRQDIMNLYQQGLIGNPQDPSVKSAVLSAMEQGDVAEFWDDLHLDQQNIEEAITMLEQGVTPPFDEMDNHMLYIKRLNQYRKTDKYKHLPMQIRLGFARFREEHVQCQMHIMNPALGVPSPEELMAAKQGVPDSIKMAGAAAGAQLHGAVPGGAPPNAGPPGPAPQGGPQ
jgi:hypothetical protein